MNVIEGINVNDRDLIEAIVGNFFIIDYGFITEVNPDKTINVTHAKRPVTTEGKTLAPIKTENIEVLTVSCKGFSIKFDYAKGDKVLLVGLKNYINHVSDVASATETTSYVHYSRETLKAIPLCLFDNSAKVQINIENGVYQLQADKIELNGKDKQFVTWAELDSALKEFITEFNGHVHGQSGAGVPLPSLPTIDISAAKTTSVVTGG